MDYKSFQRSLSMAFKVLSKDDWESQGFVGGFSLGICNWFGWVDCGDMNDWDEVDGVLVGDTCSWGRGRAFCGE